MNAVSRPAQSSRAQSQMLRASPATPAAERTISADPAISPLKFGGLSRRVIVTGGRPEAAC